MGNDRDWDQERDEKIEAALAAADHIIFITQAADRKARDDMHATQVESLLRLGRELGQEKEYNKRVAKLLKELGY